MPKRRAIPRLVKDGVRARQKGLCGCRRQCGAKLPPDGSGQVHFQHEPPLRLREALPDDSDWSPSQHSAKFIYAEMKECHELETHGGPAKATYAGSDRHAIEKTKRLRGEAGERPKRQWPSGQKIPSRPWPKRQKCGIR